jgi:hypothetical protein
MNDDSPTTGVRTLSRGNNGRISDVDLADWFPAPDTPPSRTPTESNDDETIADAYYVQQEEEDDAEAEVEDEEVLDGSA